jgi:uncharacterized protein YdeI (YjbR/CyaY-like superfamily)
MVATRRPRHRMPVFIKSALVEAKLSTAYMARPPYQRKDYIGWIVGAKREDTKQRRLAQMLAELRDGNLYMKMKWSPQSSV